MPARDRYELSVILTPESILNLLRDYMGGEDVIPADAIPSRIRFLRTEKGVIELEFETKTPMKQSRLEAKFNLRRMY